MLKTNILIAFGWFHMLQTFYAPFTVPFVSFKESMSKKQITILVSFKCSFVIWQNGHSKRRTLLKADTSDQRTISHLLIQSNPYKSSLNQRTVTSITFNELQLIVINFILGLVIFVSLFLDIFLIVLRITQALLTRLLWFNNFTEKIYC